MRTRGRAVVLVLAVAVSAAALEATEPAGAALLIRDARVFDGRADRLSGPVDLLIVEDRIGLVSTRPLPVPDGARVLEAGGRVLMPGLIDAHVRLLPGAGDPTRDPAYEAARAAAALRDVLARGFTSVRDLSGGAAGLARAIDEGLVPGPRVWAAGAPGPLGRRTQLDLGLPPGLRGDLVAAAREGLRRGGAFVAVQAGGGLAPDEPPLDVVDLLPEELSALARTASDWGTYASVAAYSPEGARRAVEAGARCVDHGHLLDEPTLRLLAERGVFLTAAAPTPADDGSYGPRGEQALEHFDRVMSLARDLQVRVAFASGLPLELLARQPRALEARAAWVAPVNVLRQATSINGELLALSGRRSPHRGPIGVVEEGALADLLIVDGDPLADLSALARDPARTIRAIVQGGRVVKDELSRPAGAVVGAAR